ncbi:DNA topoisomerase I; mitochondrial [Camelus dromedarius]|uniref:DNA topoisomerase n=1 Tax=Camelus dromedarius TaxID=9838 RepID=A0A5N4CG27_CAMDR|nr:DNA topoisomerase I; mitochondrial [Camelus dromedarius]
MDGLTAKVFWTYNASVTLQGQLRALTRGAALAGPPLQIEAKQQQVVEAKAELEKARADHRASGDSRSKRRLPGEEGAAAGETGGTAPEAEHTGHGQGEQQVALGTSKLNCLDPQISIAWCKRFGVPVEIYNKVQREKFAWALDMADEDFEF